MKMIIKRFNLIYAIILRKLSDRVNSLRFFGRSQIDELTELIAKAKMILSQNIN